MTLNDLDQDATFEYLTALNENVAAVHHERLPHP